MDTMNLNPGSFHLAVSPGGSGTALQPVPFLENFASFTTVDERGFDRNIPRAGLDQRSLSGPVLIQPKVHVDRRGSFVKTWHPDLMRAHGVVMDFAEEFYSVSRRGVLRGMHFQAPPQAHSKLVYCVSGRILDVVLDLRPGQPGFGRSYSWELSEENARMLFIPPGFAHGFLALGDHNAIVYKTSTVHSPAHDCGVRWDSFGFSWPETPSILSDRDRAQPTMGDLVTPFPVP